MHLEYNVSHSSESVLLVQYICNEMSGICAEQEEEMLRNAYEHNQWGFLVTSTPTWGLILYKG